MTRDHSDAHLAAAIAQGDREAFEHLYRRHQSTVYRFARHMTGSPEVAEDVTQEVFLNLMRTASRYDSTRGSFQTYLYTITRSFVARGIKRKTMVTLDGAEEIQSDADDPLKQTMLQQMIERLRAAVVELPARYREIIVLCDLEEISYAEAAAIVGCPEGTVRSRLHRARRVLAARLRDVSEGGKTVQQSRCLA